VQRRDWEQSLSHGLNLVVVVVSLPFFAAVFVVIAPRVALRIMNGNCTPQGAAVFATVLADDDPPDEKSTAAEQLQQDISEERPLIPDSPSPIAQPYPQSSCSRLYPSSISCCILLSVFLLTIQLTMLMIGVRWSRSSRDDMWTKANLEKDTYGVQLEFDSMLSSVSNAPRSSLGHALFPPCTGFPPPFSPALMEAAWILTGQREAALLLDSCNRLQMSCVLQRLAITVLQIRPALQRDLWVNDCRTHLPCPYPSWQVRVNHPITDTDNDVIAWLLQQADWLSAWTTSWRSLPSPSALFHGLASNTSQPSAFVPGEPMKEQQLAWRFQTEVHARQHPRDCFNASLLLMDAFYELGGFGSWSHARAAAFALGVRAGRVVVEMEGEQQYAHAYSDCTRRKGLGGCDVLLPTSSCTVPDNWRALVDGDRQRFSASHDPWTGGSLQHHLHYLHDRRLLLYSEIRSEMMWTELHHSDVQGCHRKQLREELPSELDAYRLMPECWWNRQALAYLMRMTRQAESRLLQLVAQSLRLSQPHISAANALAYSDALTVTSNHTSHWWLAIHALKVEWQFTQLAPGLPDDLRVLVTKQETGTSECESGAEEVEPTGELSERVTPLLGYAFIRHGDKAKEATLFDDEAYITVMENTARNRGLRSWYVGSDHLLTPERVLIAAAALNVSTTTNSSIPLLRLFSSVLVNSIADKMHHPLASGFDWKTSEGLNDTEREAIVWRTLLEFGVAQIADVFLSVWPSNHPRMAYELATAASETMATAPFLRLVAKDEDDQNRCQISKVAPS
jgi:hypothetical protein